MDLVSVPLVRTGVTPFLRKSYPKNFTLHFCFGCTLRGYQTLLTPPALDDAGRPDNLRMWTQDLRRPRIETTRVPVTGAGKEVRPRGVNVGPDRNSLVDTEGVSMGTP